jgi:hypothetical protein
VVLYRTDRARYRNEGHGHKIEVTGNIVDLKSVIFHDDRKSLRRWLASQQRYARVEAQFLFEQPKSKLSAKDKIRLMAWPAPILVSLYTLLVMGAILDGWPGLHYVLQRLCAEVMLALEIVDRRLNDRTSGRQEQLVKDLSKQQPDVG